MTAPASPSSSLPVAVIGGGATGLAAAFRLARSGRKVRLFEAGTRVGGAVGTERQEGWLIEAGPNSFLENAREIVDLLRELGLENERVAASPTAKKRFIVRNGQLCAVPMSPPALFGTPLFSFGSKLRLLTEAFSRPRRRTSDVSLADFVRDHFGQEIVDYALNPFVSGIYAGDPKKLSARHSFPKLWEAEQKKGSLIRGQIAQAKERKAAGHPKSQVISFRDGLQTLTDTLQSRLPAGSIELGARIETLMPGSPWQVVWSRSGETHTEQFSRVVLATPARSLAQLAFGSLGERPLATLQSIEYPPVASLFLGFRREHIVHPLDGFGALVPAIEQFHMLGVLFSSSLFPNRAPEGHVALTVMVGGSFQPEIAGRSLDEITEAVLPELDRLLGVKGAPEFRRLHFWPHAIPQYQLGYERHLETMNSAERRFPGLHIAGHIRDGIALPACIVSGLNTADRIVSLPTV
ncbi:protoporphyrinogen oxidase [Opitutaceae bacterium EW11]|nr:protoporphyrinogen oxidase [Opitutaceae bacterium EW11]